jgi:ketosteroid isomerase-like protein
VATDVETVRRFYEALRVWLQEYRERPRPLEEMESLDRVFELLTADAVWDWPLTPDSFQGRERLLGALRDYLETAGNWQVEVEDVQQGSKAVFSATRVSAEGRESGAPVDQRTYSAITVRDGKIAHIEDHLDRDEGAHAAGLES